MEKVIAAFEVRRQLGKVLDDVIARGDSYIVERHGEAVAAVVPIKLYEQWKRSRDAFFDRMAEMAATAQMSEDEAMALALEAQQAVRAERRRAGS